MSTITPKVLIVGNTPRWIQGVKAALPSNCDVHTRLDFVAAIEALFIDEGVYDLCIVANKLDSENEGLHILQELREDGRATAFIVYSKAVTETSHKKITQFDGIVITPQNLNQPSPELQAKVAELLRL